ncbi:MAG: lytic transglycosylase domain-containing protein [Planktomarina sp.]
MKLLLAFLCIAMALPAAAQTVTSPDVRPQARPTGDAAAVLLPPTPEQALAAALRVSDDWDAAKFIAEPAGALAVDLMEWRRLRAGDGTFADTMAFLAKHPDWPGLPLLRQNSEKTIPADAKVIDVLGFFDGQAPRTLVGALRLAQAHRALGEESKAIATAVRGWTTFPGSQKHIAEMQAHFGAALAPAHPLRLDTMLWDGHTNAARQMLPLVDEDRVKLAQARIGFQIEAGDIDTLLAAVPPQLQNDAGLAHDRFHWRMSKGHTDGAAQLILARSNRAQDLGQPAKWARQRISLTRDLMWDGEWSRAYHMAKDNHLTTGADFARLEWMAGYIALRELNLPQRALNHFKAHGSAVTSPISVARTHYWQGRSHRVLGNETAAMASFTEGAKYQVAFYGLLSAEEAGIPLDPALVGAEQFPADADHPVTQSSVYQIAQLLHASNNPRLGIRFLTHLAETQDRDTFGTMTALAEAQGRPNYELLLAKRGVQYGMLLHRPYLPLHPLITQVGDVSAELALSIARRESEFFPDAFSSVGAQGLMQLMPPTAREMANRIGLPFSKALLSSDPAYNARLGITYLKELQDTFGNSPVQMAAAYNAGPSRPKRWMRIMGDPRNGDIDVVDWIERVPFTETRNYIMRVTETMPGYRARMTGQTGPVTFTALLNGEYIPPPPPLAPLISKRPQLRDVPPVSVPATE